MTETNIQADHSVVKRLGHWTRQSTLQVRARNGKVVLDLRSPQIDGAPIRLHGNACDSQVRIQRAGVAELTSLRSLARLKELHRAHRPVASER